MSEQKPVKGRAYTYEERRRVMERVLAAWMKSPHERLGQFIHNAVDSRLAGGDVRDAFYVEDLMIADACEKYAEKSK